MLNTLNTQLAQLHSRHEDLTTFLARLHSSRLPQSSKEVQTRSITKVLNDVKAEMVDLTIKRDALLQSESTKNTATFEAKLQKDINK